MEWWNRDERLVYRDRFEPLWMDPPRTLVLAALPGYGKRTFMRQCESFLRDHAPTMRIARVVAGTDLAERLDLTRAQGTDEVLLCIDARTAPAHFWDELERALRTRSWAKAVVSCYDGPPALPDEQRTADAGEAHSRVVLHEADLAFDRAELTEIGTLLAEENTFFNISLLDGKEKGWPALIGQRVKRILSRGRQGAWTFTEDGISDDIAALEDRSSAEAFSRSRIASVLRDVRELPAFTPDLIVDAAGGSGSAESIIARLAAVPLFEIDSDDEFGTRQCMWTRSAWQHLKAEEQPTDTRTRIERGLARVRDSSRLIPQLGMLLELGELAEAEELAMKNFRSLLLFCDSRTAVLLNNHPRIAPGSQPMLTLLRNEFRIRKGAFTRQLGAENRTAYRRLAQGRAIGLYPAVLRNGRLAHAAAAAGNRDQAKRHIFELVALLDHVDEAEEPKSGINDPDRRLVLDACYLAYWAALQVDQLLDARKLGEAMARWGSTADRLHAMEEFCLTAAQDVAGLRSLAQDGLGPGPERYNHAQSILQIEEGLDSPALQSVLPMIAQLGTGYSRSAIDALALLVQSITASEDATLTRTERALHDSARLWDDGVPSTFLTWAAINTLAVIGAKDEARVWLDRIEGVKDPFADMARLSFTLWNGQPKATLGILQSMSDIEMPRLVICTWVFAATAFAQLGQEDSARLSLERGWRIHPAPRLFRFAFRFVSETAFQQLQDTVGTSHESLQRLFEDAATDRRAITWDARPHITPTEHEILQMLGQGKSNAEIAKARFIAVGTLRTHLKSLYKKLGATDRSGALAAAVRFGLMDH